MHLIYDRTFDYLIFMFEILTELSTITGLPNDLLKTVISLLLSFLLSPLYRVITSKLGRNILSISIGFSFLYFIIEQWAFFILGSVVIPFLLFKITSRPFLCSVICSFFLLLYVHTYRFIKIYSVWQVDCSVYIMLLVTKLTYYAKWLQKDVNNKNNHTIVDFLAYNFYFPGVIAGPTFSFEIYLDFINNKFNIDLKSLNILKALKPLFITAPLLILYIFILPYFHGRWVLQNEFYLSLSLLSKMLILNFVGFFYRLKYYTGWYFAQAATNLSGLSMSPSGQYDAVIVVSLMFQVQPNARTKTQYWNASNQEWLKDVVFDALGKYGQNVAFFGTFIVSAYWHGIYLTYYVGFILWGILLHLNKWFYKWSLAYPKLSNSLIVRVLAFVIGSTVFNYIGMFMSMLNWSDAVSFHADIYYWGTILLVVFLLLSFVVKPPRQPKPKKQN